jgi:hypothetical protein
MQNIEEKVKSLPPELQKEVEDFVQFLSERRMPKQDKLRLSWAGGLREFREKYNSLELQKKSLEWWGD